MSNPLPIKDCEVAQLTLIASTYSDFLSTVDSRLAHLPGETIHVLFFIDADNLKRTNDTLGHSAGDALIFSIFKILQNALPDNAVIYRKGGDEFLAYYKITNGGDANEISNRLCHKLNQPFGEMDKSRELSCSIGAAISTGSEFDALELIDRADVALLAAKRSGKSQLKFFGEKGCESIEFERSIIKYFPAALIDRELEVYFQPIYQFNSRRIKGGEALVRWNSAHHGQVPAPLIINAAMKTGKMKNIGMYVLKSACQAALDWPADTFVTVNFSASDFQRREFAMDVLEVASCLKLDPKRLKLEITEVEPLGVGACLRSNIAVLQKEGVQIGLDDFGTGYSSMGYIDQFPADFIKIDKSIIRNCNTRHASRVFLRAISNIAENSMVTLIAEGVETVDELSVVSGAGIYFSQGFYYSPAVDQESFLMLIEKGKNLDQIINRTAIPVRPNSSSLSMTKRYGGPTP